jgi:hypothetical protein
MDPVTVVVLSGKEPLVAREFRTASTFACPSAFLASTSFARFSSAIRTRSSFDRNRGCSRVISTNLVTFRMIHTFDLDSSSSFFFFSISSILKGVLLGKEALGREGLLWVLEEGGSALLGGGGGNPSLGGGGGGGGRAIEDVFDEEGGGGGGCTAFIFAEFSRKQR